MIKLFTVYLFVLTLSLSLSRLAASPQMPDYIIYKADTIATYNLIVEQYLQRHEKTESEKLFGLRFRNRADGNFSFNCWRGYQAIYKIDNDSLFPLPDTTPPATNYVEIIKDKSWWGEFTYTGKDPEYYSVHFNIDSTLVWSQFSGDYNGKWAVKDNELTMHVDRGNAEIKAIINNDKLSNITDNTGNSTIDIVHLIVRSNLLLDNTVWDATPILSNGIYGYLISFMSDLKVDIQETYFEPPSLYKSYLYPDNKYKRSTEGAVVRSSFSSGGAGSTSVFFAIIISDSAMIGSSRNPNNQWTAVRYE